nr:fibronectin type III domain-containing protein [Kineococcus aurantiacus]
MAVACVLAGVVVSSAAPAVAQVDGRGTRDRAVVGAEASGTETVGAPQRVVAPGRTADVSGTVLRLDGDEGEATTLLRTATGFVPLTGDAAARLAVGAKVALRVSASATRPDAVQVEQVLSVSARTLASSAAGGVQHLKVALVAPAGTKPGDYSAADVRAAVARASDYWSAVTNGKVSFVVDTVADWTTSPYTCAQFTSIWSAAANATGYTGAASEHVLTVFPRSAYTSGGCSYGKGTLGADATSSGAAYVADISQSVIAHELGHNMGYDHANARYGTAAAPDPGHTGGTYVGYGDVFDVMGFSDPQDRIGTGALNVVHRDQQAALFPGQVRTVTSSTNVTLQAVGSTATPAVKGAKVVDGSDVYYLEYRANVGTDVRVFSDGRRPAAGVRVLRRDTTSTYNASVVLDPTPTGSTSDWNQVVPVGGTFTTASGRLKFTVASAAGENATVAVTVGGATTGTVLAAPSGVSATSTAAGTATVAFTGVSGATGYVVTPYLDGVAQTAAAVTAATSPVTVRGLATGRSYTFGVTAKNAAGTSGEARSAAVTVAGAPARPTGLSATVAGNVASLSWAPGATGTRYRVDVLAGTRVVWSGTTDGASVRTSALPAGSYTFTVTATGASGTTTSAPSAAFTVAALAAPGAVTITGSGVGDRSAWVAFTPATTGGAATSYQVTIYSGGVAVQSGTVPATTGRVTVSGLVNGRGYTLGVRARNGAGTGVERVSAVLVPGARR